MPKRKSRADPETLPDAPPPKSKSQDAESDSDSDTSIVNVDFEYFDPQPAIDFHGLKTLLRQLLDRDAQLFDLSALADLILSQPLLGSTVKVDGNETDPYAMLTILNLWEHKEKKIIADLTAYLIRLSASSASLSSFPALLSSSSTQVGLILTERFINMPHAVIPPMYSMLLEEISWALAEKEPYAFTHYLVLSRTYVEVASNLSADGEVSSGGQQKKKKKNKKQKTHGGDAADDLGEVFFFHPEDEVLQRHALAYGGFEYETPMEEGASDSKRAFQELGIRPRGHLVLIEATKLGEAVDAVREFLAA